MNEINVMKGIDFKSNQKRIRNAKIKQLKKERKINKILNVGIVIAILIFFVTVLFANKNMTDSAMKSCQGKGNTYEYCIAHV